VHPGALKKFLSRSLEEIIASVLPFSRSVTLSDEACLRGEGNSKEECTMSVQEIHTLAQHFADAFTNKHIKAVLDMLAEDVEIFDHVPYRFDTKALFATYVAGAVEGLASMDFGFRQPSCRVFNDTTGIVNAYDMFTGSCTLSVRIIKMDLSGDTHIE
jgi:hypothetical protein